MPKLIQEQQKTAFETLKADFKWSNVMQTPKVEKVVISVGVGKMAKDKGKVEIVANRLAKITGQKPASRGAKKSIATYKTRIGDKVGYQITLRGKRAEDFLNRLVHIALLYLATRDGILDRHDDNIANRCRLAF